MTEKPWWSDPSVLFNKDTWMNFFPDPDSPLANAYNAIVRFSVYGGVLLFLVSRNFNYLLAIPAVMLTTYLMYQINPPKEHMSTMRQLYHHITKTRPTVDNPLMNVMMHDYTDNPTRDPASSIYKKSVRDEVTRDFYAGTNIMDLAETRSKKFLERQFITTPNSKIPNDQGEFAKFLFKDSNPTPKKHFEGQFALPGYEISQ